jgi:hypothetical protein
VRRLTALAIAALLVAAVASPVGATQSDERRAFLAVLKASNEVATPPVESDGFGFAAIGVNRTETAIGFVLTAFRLENIVIAHIHCGAAGVNGPVVADLFVPPAPVTKNGLLAHGVITDADVIPRVGNPACPGDVENLDDLIAQIRAGNAYVNVHTTAVPAGEIRGQLK